MHKVFLLALACLLPLFSLTACYDARELDDVVHVVAIGIDKGVSDKWRLTVQFPTMKESPGGGGGGMKTVQGSEEAANQDGHTYVTIDAPSFFTGVNMLNASIPRRLNFMHTQTLVFSEELAKEGLIGEFLAPMIRFREIRRSLHVIISKGPATDYIKENKPLIGTSLSKGMETIAKAVNEISYFPHTTLMDFYDAMKSNCDQPAATLAAVNDYRNLQEGGPIGHYGFKTGGEYYAGEIPRKGGNKIELFGTAVFDGDKMVGELNGEETRLMLVGRGDFKRGFFTLPDPQKTDSAVSLDVRQAGKPDIKITFEEGRPVINLRVQLEGDILAVQSGINYESPELKPVLENAFAQYLKNELDGLAGECKNLKVDIFRFGRTAVMQFGTIQEWEEYNWKKQFENAEITTEVNFTIKRPGTMLKSSPIRTREGKD